MINKPSNELRTAIRQKLDDVVKAIYLENAEVLGSCDENEMLAVCFGIAAEGDDIELAARIAARQ